MRDSMTPGVCHYREKKICKEAKFVQNGIRRLPVPSSSEGNMGRAVQYNFRRLPLPPSREESISKVGLAVQHNFRRLPLPPSREENISRAGLAVQHDFQARIQGVGAGARAHPWGGVSPFKMHYSIAFKHQFIIGRPPLGEILYPRLTSGA